MDTIQHWKRVWKTINSRPGVVPREIVKRVLYHSEDYFIHGLMKFTPYTEESYTKCLEKAKVNANSLFGEFIKKLSVSLSLDAGITWSMLCNYIMFEYCGKIEDTTDILRDPELTNFLIRDISSYYLLERSFLLKTIRYVLEEHVNSSNPLKSCFVEVINKITYVKLQKGFMDQYKLLLEGESHLSSDNFDVFEVKRNFIEQLQVLFCLLTSMNFRNLEIAELLELLRMFKEATYMTAMYKIEEKNPAYAKLFQQLKFIQNAILVAGFQNLTSPCEVVSQQHFAEIDDLMEEYAFKDYNAPVLLLWTCVLCNPDEDYENQELMNTITSALDDGACLYLRKLSSCDIFVDTIAGSVAKTGIYHLFGALCEKLGSSQMYAHEGASMLLADLFRKPELGTLCLAEEKGGAKDFCCLALSLFPHHFQPLSSLMKSLINTSTDINKTTELVSELHNLSVYTKTTESSNIVIRDGLLCYSYKPLANASIEFEPGTKITTIHDMYFNEPLTQFHSKYSYIYIMKYIYDLFCNRNEFSVGNQIILTNMLIDGYNVLFEIIKSDWIYALKYPDIYDLLVMGTSSLIAENLKMSEKEFSLINICFEIITYIFKYQPIQILAHLYALKLFPKIVTEDLDHNLFSKPNLLSYFTLIDIIEDEYKKHETRNILILYVRFVNDCVQTDAHYDTVQVPGLIYIMAKVFPIITDDSYSDKYIKRVLLVEITEMLYTIMQKKQLILNVYESFIQRSCMNLFLNDKMYVKRLYGLIDTSCSTLQINIASDVNWKKNEALDKAKIIKQTLGSTLCLLKYVRDYKNVDAYQFVVSELFIEIIPGVTILRVITDYIGNCFDYEVAEIACELISVFALISVDSVLPALKFDAHQLSCIFLERLQDHLETLKMKMSILELVSNCISNQIYMTGAFFNKDIKNNAFLHISIFMNNIEKNNENAFFPLHQRFFNLLHELWFKRRFDITRKITEQENFWKTLTLPLLEVHNLDLCFKILEILTIELHVLKKPSQEFLSAIKSLLNGGRYLESWFDHIIGLIPQATDQLVFALTSALTIMKKFLHYVGLAKIKYLEFWNSKLDFKCLQLVFLCSNNPTSVNMLTECLELSILYPFTLTEKVDATSAQSVAVLRDITFNLSSYYELMNDYCKTMFLTIISRAFENFEDFLISVEELPPYFLSPLMRMFSSEYKNIMEKTHKVKLTEEDLYIWVKIICLINELLDNNFIKPYRENFIEVNYLGKLAEMLAISITYSFPSLVVRAMSSSFIALALSNLDLPFDHSDMNVIYKETAAKEAEEKHTPLTKNALIIFSDMIILNAILLNKRKVFVADSVIHFIHTHQESFIDILKMVRTEANTSSLTLAVNILRFLCDAIHYQKLWIYNNLKSLQDITEEVKRVLNISIGVMLRPRTMSLPHQLSTGISGNKFIDLCNQFLEIIIWSCIYFTNYNPNVASLLNFYREHEHIKFLEYDFRIPPTMNSEPHLLTFGGLLCILRFFCKIMNEVLDIEEDKKAGKDRNLSISEEFEEYNKTTLDTINSLYNFKMEFDLKNPKTLWFLHLNLEQVRLGLAAVSTFIASQSFLTLRDANVERNIMRYIRRELIAELIHLYKVVDRLLVEKYDKEATNFNLKVTISGKKAFVTDLDDAYLVVIVAWFRQVCELKHSSRFDAFLSNWHAKSTWINNSKTYVKETSVNINEDD